MAPRVLQAVSSEIMRCNDRMLMDAMEGERRGREVAAQCVFEGWEGVNWEEGLSKEQE